MEKNIEKEIMSRGIEEEVVSIRELKKDVRRYENAIVKGNTSDNFSLGIEGLGVIAKRILGYYLDTEYKSEYTGNQTYMNVEESYICSGVYTSKRLGSVYGYEKKSKYNRDGTKVVEEKKEYKVLNKNKDREIRYEAINFWKNNKISAVIGEYYQDKMGGISPVEAIGMKIVNKGLINEDKKMELEYLKLSTKILGMDKNTKNTINNLYEKGGKEELEKMREMTDNEVFDLGLEDMELVED